jgi:hypothetical protein
MMFKRLTNTIFLPTGSPNRDSETGTQVRVTKTDDLTKLETYTFADGKAIVLGLTNVGPGINGLSILFSDSIYMRIGENLVFLYEVTPR